VSDEDGIDEGDFDGEEFDDELLDEHETALIQQDLVDLSEFEATFRPEGYRGVAVWCHDCAEEHYYPWDMLRENLELLLSTGETPVHEPAFAPEPDRYIQWDYARGYVDALRDVGVPERLEIEACDRCGLQLPVDLRQANFCPRCGTTLLGRRLETALADLGLPNETLAAVLRAVGLPRA
jgi:RNase P subunit RPR2